MCNCKHQILLVDDTEFNLIALKIHVNKFRFPKSFKFAYLYDKSTSYRSG